MEKKISCMGHRGRLRQKYLEKGYESLLDYEVVELLLTFVKARVDTKPLAKTLIKKYGTLEGILKANINELREIKGIGEVTSLFLKFIGDVSAFSFKDKIKKEKVSFRKKEQLLSFLRNDFGYSENEQFKVLFLNTANEMIEIEKLFEGTINKSAIYPRNILKRALHHNARSLVFVHNHPSGNVNPSEKDITFTRDMKKFFRIVDVNVLDHIIITENSYFSFLEEGII